MEFTKYKKFRHKKNFVAVRVPSEATWCEVVVNSISSSYAGKRLQEMLDIGDYILRYGTGNPNAPIEERKGLIHYIKNRVAIFYDPKALYSVEHEINPVCLGFLSLLDEETCRRISESKNKIYQDLFLADFPVEKKEYNYIIVEVE